MNNIFEAANICVNYGKFEAVSDVSFSAQKGDYIGIVGPNGSGKTTLMKALLGLLPLASGSITFKDNSAKNRISYLPQKSVSSDKIFPASVMEIVLTGRLSSSNRLGFLRKEDHAAAEETLEKLKILDLKDKRIGRLSGGQHQRVLLARAIVSKPEILILDEPTSALDPNIREDFYRMLTELNEKDGMTLLLVSHDISSIGNYTKKLLYLDRKLVFYGTYNDFCGSDSMNEYFGYAPHHMICGRHHHE